nr:HD-GYP domain-containing protein [Solidesulfovibrio aerotolerans]
MTMPPPLLFVSPAVLPVGSDAAHTTHGALMDLVHQLATSLGKAIDAKDPHTMAHSEEVAEVARHLALAMGLSSEMADCIHVAGHLHDIGKIGVPDAVLGTPGSLTPEEWVQMQDHPSIGAAILLPLACLRQTGIVDMVLAHHERYDGGGYPFGLSGSAIPLGARIITLADSLSAMLRTRPYRPAMGFAAACREIVRGAGSQFDPQVATVFLGEAMTVRGMLGPDRDAGTTVRR